MWGLIERRIHVVFGLLIPILVRVAFFTVAERKVIAGVQRRHGPSVVGLWGLLQAIADGLKLVCKEMIFPAEARLWIYVLSPILRLMVSLSVWLIMPVSGGGRSWLVDSKYTVLRWLRLTSLGVYGIIFSGWASGSRYPFLGSVRAVAQLISYELILVSVVFIISFVTFSFNFIEIINFQESSGWLAVPLFPAFLVFLVVGLAETNRTPFDLPEREAELVAGYNLEYSSLLFAFFFLREYANMLVIAVITVSFFIGGWKYFVWKVLLRRRGFIIVRAALPRFRYDQLMMLGWHVLLPLIVGYLVRVVFILL